MRILAAFAVTVSMLPAAVPGECSVERQGERFSVVLTRVDTLVDARRSLLLPAQEMKGFDAASLDRNGAAVKFRLEWTPGTVVCEATVEKGIAKGKFHFIENREYAASMKKLLHNWWDPGKMFDLATSQQTRDYVRDLEKTRYVIPLDKALFLQSQGVAPSMLQEMKLSGHDVLSSQDMIRLKNQGVAAWDLQVLRGKGLGNLTVDEIIRHKINGIP
ncbi:MAG: hypothetical protein HYZ37_08845 [Candidatus Solibacter usitatus]|nr:hypothetical protein [Candidatus Solibacter usitatus]